MRPAPLVRSVLFALLLLVVATAGARAELRPINPFAATEVVPGPPSAFAPPSAAAPFQATGPLGRLFAWVLDKQQGLQRMLATSVKGLKTDNPMAGALTLAGLSFLYGILHAVGPGHGKTIISLCRRQRRDGKTWGNHLLHRSWPTGDDRSRPRRLAAVRARCIRTSGQCLVQPAGECELRDDCARRPLPADYLAAALIPELARRACSE